MKKLKYLVTGTGRCGTVFCARLLTSLGIPCGHECCFDWRGLDYAKVKLEGYKPLETSEISKIEWKNNNFHSIPSWLDESAIEAESSYMAAPFLDDDCLKDTKIIHVIRNPIKVLNSFTRYLDYFENNTPSTLTVRRRYESFIFYHLHELYQDITQDERAALYIARWNKMIEDKIKDKDHIVYRVEDPLDKLFEFLKVEPKEYFQDNEVNTLIKPGLDRFHLSLLKPSSIKDEFIAHCRKYNYNVGLDKTSILL